MPVFYVSGKFHFFAFQFWHKNLYDLVYHVIFLSFFVLFLVRMNDTVISYAMSFPMKHNRYYLRVRTMVDFEMELTNVTLSDKL